MPASTPTPNFARPSEYHTHTHIHTYTRTHTPTGICAVISFGTDDIITIDIILYNDVLYQQISRSATLLSNLCVETGRHIAVDARGEGKDEQRRHKQRPAIVPRVRSQTREEEDAKAHAQELSPVAEHGTQQLLVVGKAEDVSIHKLPACFLLLQP